MSRNSAGKAIVWILVALIALGAGAYYFWQHRPPPDSGQGAVTVEPVSEDSSAPPTDASSPTAEGGVAGEIDAAAPEAQPPESSSTPAVVPETSAGAMNPRRLAGIRAEVHKLHAECLKLRDSRDPARMKDLERRWWELTVQIHNSAEMAQPSMVALREAYLGVSRSWRAFLGASADTFAIDSEFAERLITRAREWER